MTLAKRRLLYFIFIGAFCIITPLVILYANGYQLSLNSKALVKTGMLIVDSFPQNAVITLNGKSQTDFVSQILSPDKNITTPAKIKNLIPGEYTVGFDLAGYWPWKKKLPIKPGESTYAEDVILFKKSSANLLSAGEKNLLLLSPDSGKILAAGSQGAEIFDAASQLAVASSTASSAKAIWSNDGKMVLAGNMLIQLDQFAPGINLEKILGKNILNAKWSSSDSSVLYYQIGNQIFQYNISEQKSENIFSESAVPQTLKGLPLSDFVLIDNKLYVAFYKQSKTTILFYDLAAGKSVRELSVPSSKDVAFINYEQGYLNLLDRPSSNLHLINFDNYYPLEDTVVNISNGYWVAKDRLLGWNDSEIFIYDKNIKQKNLLTRVAQPVRQAAWHPSNNYIIYATDQEITSFELDDREQHNSISLVKGENIRRIALNKKATLLYFISKAGLSSIEL